MTSNNKQTSVLAGLPNAFEEPNWVWCFNHTLQLSAKALKPFYSARLLDTNDDINSDDGILVLQAADDKEEDNEDENEDGMDDDEDKEKEDPFTILDNDEREILIQNTEAVHTTLMKVCTFLLFVLISVAALGSQTLLHCCPFHHHCPSHMA